MSTMFRRSTTKAATRASFSRRPRRGVPQGGEMDRSRFGQGGLFAAGAAVAVATVMAVTGAAGAAQQAAADHGVYARDANGPCYSTSESAATCATSERGDLAIATGDSVTWHIGAPNSTQAHNAAGSNDVPA